MKNLGLGVVVKKQRRSAQLTQAMLAERSGLSRGWISRIETGKAEPSWAVMRRLSAALGMPLRRLAREAERMEPPGQHGQDQR